MSTFPLDIGKVLEYLLDLLPRAGQIARRYFHSEGLPTQTKTKLDFVTAADLAVDDFLRKNLLSKFSHIALLTEETAPKDLSSFLHEELLWVVDPIDGTTNFSRGNDNYSINVALVSHGLPLVGVVFAPVQSRLFWARADRDYAYWNGRRIHLSEISELSQTVVCTDWSHILSTRDETTNVLRKIFHHVRQIKILGSAATDLTLLARGGVDVYHHVYLYPWDVAASSIVAQKAGAKITDIYGGQWNVFTPSILAANPALHQKILTLLNE